MTPQYGLFATVHRGDRFAPKHHPPLGWSQKPDKQFQKRGLATTRFADDRNGFPPLQGKIDATKYLLTTQRQLNALKANILRRLGG